jgi:hypothetical protein
MEFGVPWIDFFINTNLNRSPNCDRWWGGMLEKC